MYGYARGWWHERHAAFVPGEYRYLGPCRCGFGPHAFYRDPSGRIVHASQLRSGWVPFATSTVSREHLKAEPENVTSSPQ